MSEHNAEKDAPKLTPCQDEDCPACNGGWLYKAVRQNRRNLGLSPQDCTSGGDSLPARGHGFWGSDPSGYCGCADCSAPDESVVTADQPTIYTGCATCETRGPKRCAEHAHLLIKGTPEPKRCTVCGAAPVPCRWASKAER